MARPIPEQALQTILQTLQRFPEGASLEQLLGEPDLALTRRTLQRYLAHLLEQKRLIAEGQTRARRYRLAADDDHQPTADRQPDAPAGQEAIPLSSEAKTIRDAVRQDIVGRKPVGYNREFLDAYRPNESFYLPENIRRHLLTVGRPLDKELPAGTYVRQIYNRLLIDLSWNSSRLEGNTYTRLETELLFARGESAEGKELVETQMILNHKEAIELLVTQAEEIGFNRYTICNLHALLSDNLLSDPDACGRLRARSVGITGTTFLPLEGPQMIEECFQQLLDTAEAIEDPFEQAFFAMVHLPYLQPFEEVNKRVSRLAANIPLIRYNLCPLSFIDVPERPYIDGLLGVYELNRVELLRDVFVWAYERSSARYVAVQQSLGEPDPFRIRYRQLLIGIVGEIVKDRLDKKNAALHIRKRALANAPEEDRLQLADVAEKELASLHEGNIARYRLRPSEYKEWRKRWEVVE